MPSRRTVLATLAAATLAPVSRPAAAREEGAARLFLQRLYRADAAARPNLAEAAGAGAVFAPELARLWLARADSGETLAFDPLLGPGAPAGSTVAAIETDARGPGRASAMVRLAEGEETTEIEIELVRTRAGWRIDEIRWPEQPGVSLRDALGDR